MSIILRALREARSMIEIERAAFVEPRDSGSRMQMNSTMSRIEIARMLERFARDAREDARLGGDE